MPYTLRRATGEDLNTIAHIYNDANQCFDTYPTNAETFQPLYDNDVIYIAQVAHHDVAFFSYNDTQPIVVLTSLYVRYDYQHSGLGTQLLDAMRVKLANTSTITLKVLKDAPQAIAFYHHYGFKPLETHHDRIKVSILKRIRPSDHSEILVFECPSNKC